MISIVIGGAVLLGALALLYGFANAKPAAVKSSVIWGLGTLGAVSLALMLFTGRGANALWALVMFGPALRQAWRGWRARHTFSRPAGPSGGDASGVETATLEMRLDLASGDMSGLVRRGAFSGRELAALDQAQLIELLEDCRAQDAESIPLLEAWLDRTHPDWREAAPPPHGPSGGAMNRAEAFAVLGLQDGASEADIRAAHRRLMQTAHPDHGGSDWLASRVNEARDFLLG